jgi:hypothetical protein
MNRFAVVLALPVLAACASDPAPTYERGWVGGRFTDVSREPRPFRSDDPDRLVVGMPEGAPGDAAVLVTAAYEDTPLAQSGLAAGDLVLSVDGTPVDGALDLRERIESHAPGSRAQVAYWRSGELRTADVVVGRETYESAGFVSVGIRLSTTIDLWPFDDGIDLFELVRIRWDEERRDLDGPLQDYREAVLPADEVEAPPQESIDVVLIPVGVAKGKRVLRQETVR